MRHALNKPLKVKVGDTTLELATGENIYINRRKNGNIDLSTRTRRLTISEEVAKIVETASSIVDEDAPATEETAGTGGSGKAPGTQSWRAGKKPTGSKGKKRGNVVSEIVGSVADKFVEEVEAHGMRFKNRGGDDEFLDKVEEILPDYIEPSEEDASVADDDGGEPVEETAAPGGRRGKGGRRGAAPAEKKPWRENEVMAGRRKRQGAGAGRRAASPSRRKGQSGVAALVEERLPDLLMEAFHDEVDFDLIEAFMANDKAKFDKAVDRAAATMKKWWLSMEEFAEEVNDREGEEIDEPEEDEDEEDMGSYNQGKRGKSKGRASAGGASLGRRAASSSGSKGKRRAK